MLFFPEDGYILAGNNSDYFVIKDPLDDGMQLKVVDKNNDTIFTKKIKGSNEGLSKPDVSCAHLSGFKVLVEPGLDINHLDGYNMTALLWATFLGQTELAKSLVDKGAQVNLMGAYGFNALSTAIASGQTDLMEYLIKHGARVNEHIGVRKLTPLHVAGFKGRLGSTQVLLKHGAYVSSIDATNATPLHYAASGGHPKVVKELVGKGADVNIKNEKGLTPLHMAARSLNVESVHILIQSGADLNSKTKEGATPLMIALEYSSDEDLLLKLLKHMVEHHNPDYSAKNNDGDTVMSLAASKGLKRVQEYLRANGAQ